MAAVTRIRTTRQETYRQIQQLQIDTQAGLVDNETYQTSLRELRVAAAQLIRSEKAAGSEATSLDAIEEEILAARARLTAAKSSSAN